MAQPIWMLLPWTIFALAAGVKFWRFARLVGQHRPGPGSGSELERMRASLERIWRRDQQRS
jgi:hypothetical protein